MVDAENSAAKQKFTGFLAQKKLRMTAQRQAIIDTVFGTRQHFTAEQLLDWSRRRDSCSPTGRSGWESSIRFG